MIVGLDMGGTHIDGVIIKDGRVISRIKKPTDREDLFNSIWMTLEELLRNYDKSNIKRINLSTTISTNAIVEGKTSKVGMIIQAGPGLKSDFLACGDENQFVSGYIDHRGVVVEDLDIVEIERARDLFKKKAIETTAAVSKFSTRNPHIEINIKEVLDEEFEITTLGHRMSGKLNFPRRVFTSYLNSAIYNTFNEFSKNIKKALQREGIDTNLFILKADGGTMDIQTAEESPVETILSGPAASLMGISSMLDIQDDAILLDIGGTTTDIFFLADGVPLFEPVGAKISKYNTLVRSIYSVSIGLGGDSYISVEDNSIKIGPERKGRPYSLGGPEPTPTDAMIYLGLIEDMDDFSKRKAEEIMGSLANSLNSTKKETSELILNIMGETIKQKTDKLLSEVNDKPVYTVKELLHGKKMEPKSVNIIGGPAKVLAPILEKHYELPCYFPLDYSVANAVGAALSKPTAEITMLADTSQGILSVPELGIYEDIQRDYSLKEAKERARELLKQYIVSMGANKDNIETEITEESSFNMVKGFYTSGKNIRIKAQVKPGYIFTLRSDDIES